MKTIGTWMIGALLAGALSGCCSCGGCVHSPIPYSEGNPYECGSGCFWGVGYNMQKYGFLHRPCNDPCDDCGEDCCDDWSSMAAPAAAPEATMPPTPQPYDTNPPAPAVPSAAEPDDAAAPDAPEP